jgi:hypothetical protein
MLDDALAQVVKLFPQIRRYLSAGDLLYLDGIAVKTFEQFINRLKSLVKAVYTGKIAGEFVDALGALIDRQITLAFREAWKDEGDEGAMPESMVTASEDMITGQYDFIGGFYRAIIDARQEQAPIDPLLSRAGQWANQYDVAYRAAVEMIRMESGGNLMWKKGATERGCETCDKLDGLILSTREWQELGLHPRGYPNPLLACGGGGPPNNCDCDLEPTEQRRTPKGFSTAMNIIEVTR